MKKKVYTQWLADRGDPVTVELIEFLDYVRNSKNKVVSKYKKGDKVFIGEIWLAEDRQGNMLEVRVRKQYNPEYHNSDDIMWGYNKYIPPNLQDDWYNPITDYPEYIQARLKDRIIPRINHDLIRVSKESKEFINFLQRVFAITEDKEFKRFLGAKINFLTHPDLASLKFMKKLSNVPNLERYEKVCAQQ